jgi:germination protein M
MNRLFMAGVIALVSLSLYGCAGTPSTMTPASSSSLAHAASSAVPADREATMVFYLPDSDAMHLQKRTMSVKAKDKTAVETLKEMVRADKASSSPIVPTGLTVKGVSIKDGVATVDFSSELKKLSPGSTVETLFVYMVVDTLTEFPNIDSVSFEIEGEPVKTLSGHMDLTQPLKRDESYISPTNK